MIFNALDELKYTIATKLYSKHWHDSAMNAQHFIQNNNRCLTSTEGFTFLQLIDIVYAI